MFVVVAVREVALGVIEFGNNSEVVIAFVDSGIGAIGVAPKVGKNRRQT